MSDQPPIEALTVMTPAGPELVSLNDPMEAKNKAISDLTASCYQKASQLQLTKDEVAMLAADFPDEAFQPGAAGKENLIYIEHAALRERLDQVIGMGQWCVVPVRRWEEKFVYQKEIWKNNQRTGQMQDVTGSHVYVDGIMLIRGAFVASAIGEMTYYPDNHVQNYGDAVEGAETAALRRCCKRLGIGLQAWRKDWCADWWQRRKAPRKQAPPTTSQPPPTTATPPATGTAPKSTGTLKVGPKFRHEVLHKLNATLGGHQRAIVHQYLTVKKFITETQHPEDWPFNKVPTTNEAFLALQEDIKKFERDIREGRGDQLEMV